MGGSDELSAMELRLVDAFTGASVLVDHLNAKITSGAEIDSATVQMYAASVSAMVRLARRLGISRRTKPVLDMDTFLALRRRERSEPPEGSIE
jgi:hypothetical protein